MSDLEKIRNWVRSYPGAEKLRAFQIDFADAIPGMASIAPGGLVEISRTEDILGNTTVQNQYNFGLYYVLEKAPQDDIGATLNADWLMDFQNWVQEQSVHGLAPTFGDAPKQEKIQAQNGVLYAADEEGTATYMVQLSVNFTKRYEVNW